jgi:ParB/RepB/Spo0J family partition protein
MIQWKDVELAVDAIDEPIAPLRESIDPTELGALIDDMAANGLLQPVGARGPDERGRFEIVWGHRRLLAARSLRWPVMPARLCPADTDPVLARLAENFHRHDLNPREEANAVASLRSSGRPLAEIARVLRRSVSWVEARVELLKWPQELQDSVARGEMTMRAAGILAEIDHDEYRKDLIDEARRTGASAATLGVWLAHYQADRSRIIANRETVHEILERRETFRVLFTCECCAREFDTRESVILRICSHCKRTLDDERRDQEREQAAADEASNGRPELPGRG